MEEKKNFGNTVSTLFAGMDKFIAAKTVVGEPIHVGDTIIIPLADVSFGMGAGAFAAEENKESDGGGAGGKMSPCAAAWEFLFMKESTALRIRIQGSLFIRKKSLQKELLTYALELSLRRSWKNWLLL